jgi:TetR/AcrR family transcriptional repressor of uid operon
MQVLDAAEDCFIRNGFHGASMADISRASSMSAGHIYNYFENKEAIINAIVERNLESSLAFFSEIENESDISRVMVASIGEGLDEKLNSSYTGLVLDMMAEASRNPKFAERLHERDRQLRDRRIRLASRSRAQRKGVAVAELTDTDVDGQVEVLMALFEGLGIRGIANPGLDKVAVQAIMERIVQNIFSG